MQPDVRVDPQRCSSRPDSVGRSPQPIRSVLNQLPFRNSFAPTEHRGRSRRPLNEGAEGDSAPALPEPAAVPPRLTDFVVRTVSTIQRMSLISRSSTLVPVRRPSRRPPRGRRASSCWGCMARDLPGMLQGPPVRQVRRDPRRRERLAAGRRRQPRRRPALDHGQGVRAVERRGLPEGWLGGNRSRDDFRAGRQPLRSRRAPARCRRPSP